MSSVCDSYWSRDYHDDTEGRVHLSGTRSVSGTLPLFSHPDPTQIPPITAEDSMLSSCQIWCIRCLIFPVRGLWRPSSCGLVFVVKCIFVSREGVISPFRKWWQANLRVMMPNCWMLQLLGCNRAGCLPGSWVAGAESGFYLRSITILIP